MRRVGDLLRAFLASRLTGDGERMIELVEAWEAIAGNAAGHVKVRDLRGENLVLEADHPGWAQIVAMRKAVILREIGRRFPDLQVRSLRVVAGAGGDPAPGTSPQPVGAPEPGEEAAAGEVEEALSGVADESLRKALRALYEGARRRPPN